MLFWEDPKFVNELLLQNSKPTKAKIIDNMQNIQSFTHDQTSLSSKQQWNNVYKLSLRKSFPNWNFIIRKSVSQILCLWHFRHERIKEIYLSLL